MRKKITLANNETLAYQHHGRGNGETLLLIHGNMSSGIHFHPLIERLKDDFELLVPDLRGFGESSYHDPIESLADFADDLDDFIRQLNLDKIHLLGWSTGGGVAMRFAAAHPEKSSSLIMVESAAHTGYPIYEKDAQLKALAGRQYQSKAAMADDPLQVRPVDEAMRTKDKQFMRNLWTTAIYNVRVPEATLLDTYIEESLKQRNLVDVDWALMNFNMSDEHNGVAQGDGTIKQVTTPTLTIFGELDPVITKSMFETTAEALPNAEKHIFKEAGHSPITDVPDDLAVLIRNHVHKHKKA